MTAVHVRGMGVALPRTRLAARTIHEVWGNVPWAVVERGGVRERTVCEPDMDTVTLAVDAGRAALDDAGVDAVDAVFLGTQTSPYLSRSSSAIVVEALGAGANVFACDLQFAGKSGSSALAMAYAWVRAGLGANALAVGSDTLGVHAAPGDPYEYTAGSGAVAMVVGVDPGIATVDAVASCTSDTPDAFRLDGERYVHRGGSTMSATDVGFPAHARSAWTALAAATGVTADELASVAVQQPDAAVPLRIASRLGFARAKVEVGLVAQSVGDTGSASALLALARVLGVASGGDRIVLLGYGAGAGCDAMLLTATGRRSGLNIQRLLEPRRLVDYATAVRYERRYQTHERLVAAYE